MKDYSKYADRFEGEAVFVYIHIPSADNGLQADEVDASIQLALERLEQYFPQVKGKQIVFCTSTWLLSPELREFLKEDSNIIKFQNRFCVVDFIEGNGLFLKFAFKKVDGPDLDYTALPEDTYLRRCIKERLVKGVPLHAGFGYFTV